MAPRILLVDDEANLRRMLGALLQAEGYEVEEAASGDAALLAQERAAPDAVFLDLLMPGRDGLETLEAMAARGLEAPVIMMSGKAQLADAVRATKLGAFQFLEKPLSPEAVLVALKAALELRRARVENQALQVAAAKPDELVGESAPLRALRALIARVGPTDARVLITGESGTGKELVATAIHRASLRRDRPFVTVNCAAIPRELLESEMFGHERGAFTGAIERRIGRFELADGGTLFLDEVGDLQPEAQAKLLRVLESGELQRIGSSTSHRVNVRVLAATNQQLDRAVADGTFREDLYFRLNVVPVQVPPLRDRLDDLPALVLHFARRFRPRRPPTLTAAALGVLTGYAWPGNVRELANLMERLAILGPDEIDAPDVLAVLPAGGRTLPPPPPPAGGDGISLADALLAYERQLVSAALAEAKGNVAEAARLLQTDRANLYRRLRRLGLKD